jgi:hypothetical protein
MVGVGAKWLSHRIFVYFVDGLLEVVSIVIVDLLR